MADLATIVRAAPIGLFMLVGSYLAARRRKSGLARAREEYPELAARLGLEHRPPTTPGLIGALRGSHRAFDVFVDPDERPRVVVYFTSEPQVILRTYEHEKRVPRGMERFHFHLPPLDAFFKERYAATGVGEALAEQKAALDALSRGLSSRLGARLLHVSVTPERVECALDFGKPHHIPAAVVTDVLDSAIRLSELVQSASGGPR